MLPPYASGEKGLLLGALVAIIGLERGAGSPHRLYERTQELSLVSVDERAAVHATPRLPASALFVADRVTHAAARLHDVSCCWISENTLSLRICTGSGSRKQNRMRPWYRMLHGPSRAADYPRKERSWQENIA